MEVDSFAMQGRDGRPLAANVESLVVNFRCLEASGNRIKDGVSGAEYVPIEGVTFPVSVYGLPEPEIDSLTRAELTNGSLPNLGTDPFIIFVAGRVTGYITGTDAKPTIRVAWGAAGGGVVGRVSFSNTPRWHYKIEGDTGNITDQSIVGGGAQADLATDDEIFVLIDHKGSGVTGSYAIVVKQDGTAITAGETVHNISVAIPVGIVDLSTPLGDDGNGGNILQITGLALQGMSIYSYGAEPADLVEATTCLQTEMAKYRTPYPSSINW